MFNVKGYLPDPEDKQYLAYDKGLFKYGSLSGDADLRPYSSPRHNQRNTSTCVAQSVVKALEIKRILKHGHNKHVDLSVLDVYYGARDLMNPKMTDQDSGTFISLACDVLRKYGVCRDEMHPFKESSLYIPPPILATREAYLNKINSHFRIVSSGEDRIEDMISNLRADNPIVFGTAIGGNWFNYKGGRNPIGVINKEDIKGNHAMVVVGWVDGLFVVENSWGGIWGENGFAYVAPEVFTSSRTKDMWVIVDGSETWYEESLIKKG